MVALAPNFRVPKFRFNGGAQARAYLIKRKIKLVHGGRGSGKSVLHHLHYIDQSKGHTDQLHGLFTHTYSQLADGILYEMERRLKRSGFALEYDHEPPLSWFRYWEKARIPIPSLQKYRGIATLSSGVHIVCGTLHHQSHRQYKSVDFRTLRIEEVFDAPEAAIRDLIPCCRCGAADDFDDDDFEVRDFGDDDDAEPECGHPHDVTLLGNPPLGSHWIFGWLDRREEAAKKYHDGTPADHQNWELLRRGVGKTIIIRVPTQDNIRNVGRDYLEELESAYSRDVASRYIDGELIREAAGRAFTEYSTAQNIEPVAYDSTREIYVWLDFDLAPRAAVFCHLLERGEYADQGPRDRDIVHFGVFGEFFSEPEMSNRDFVLALIRGQRGAGGDCDYEDPMLRGLPAAWDGLRSHQGRIIFSGDARGKDKSRHNDTLSSDWKIVQQVIQEEGLSAPYSFDLPKVNPDPSVGIHALNSKFCAIAGVRAIHIDPICKHLRRDAEVCEWDEVHHDLRHCGRGFGGTLWLRTHLIKAMIYGVSQISPFGFDGTQGADTPRMKLRPAYRRPQLTT